MQKGRNYWDNQHSHNLSRYERQINAIFSNLIREASIIGSNIHKIDKKRPFTFADYPQTKKRIDELTSKLREDVQGVVVNGIDAEWNLSNSKNSDLVRSVFGTNKLKEMSKERYRRYFSTNDAARRAFIERKFDGLTISDRIWNYSRKFKSEIETSIKVAIDSGIPASDLADNIRGFLKEPNRIFQIIRDSDNHLKLLKIPKSYTPGAGIYRSSWKNAMRLARTEINMSYRTADHLRWQQFDFVIGHEVRRSNNPYPCPLCSMLAGKYPKDFKFTGWHPQCRCFSIPILKKELSEESSADEVKEIPKRMIEFVNDNADRFKKGSMPHFVRENRTFISV